MQAVFQPVEGAAPAAPVSFKLFDGLEHGLAKDQPGLVALMLGEGHRHQGFGAGTTILALPLPGEGENQAFRRHDLAIDTALPEVFTAIVRTQAQAPGAAGARLSLQMMRGPRFSSSCIPSDWMSYCTA